jgi:uncharacterized damage-inducible protein DinB
VNDLHAVWLFTRQRLGPAHEGLTAQQLLWQPYVSGHCISEYLLHIAGAEHYWASRLTGRDPAATEFEGRLDRAVIDGFLADRPFPFPGYELTRDVVEQALAFTFAEVRAIFENPTQQQLEMALVSPIGDDVTGREGLIRLAQHAAYHTGQIWLLRQDPRFPG